MTAGWSWANCSSMLRMLDASVDLQVPQGGWLGCGCCWMLDASVPAGSSLQLAGLWKLDASVDLQAPHGGWQAMSLGVRDRRAVDNVRSQLENAGWS